jgi:hypothetical protein
MLYSKRVVIDSASMLSCEGIVIDRTRSNSLPVIDIGMLDGLPVVYYRGRPACHVLLPSVEYR